MRTKKTMTQLKIKLAALFICINLAAAFAQNSNWNLQQCIDYALKTNIQLKQAELNEKLSKANLLQSEAAVLPSLNAGASHTYNSGRTIDRFTNTFADNTVLSQSFFVSAGLNLFNGFQQYNTIRQNQLNVMAAKFDVDKARNDLALNVAGSYLQILFNAELVEIAKRQTALTTKQVERNEKLYEAGSIAKGNLLDIKAQLSSEELNVATAQNQLDLAYLNLIQLMNLDSVKTFQIQKPELTMPAEVVIANNADQIYTQALGNMPEIKSGEIRLRSAEKSISIARGNWSPTLSLNASYGTGFSGLAKEVTGVNFGGFDTIGATTTAIPVLAPRIIPTFRDKSFGDQFTDNINKTLGFQLNFPIFNGLQTHTAIARAKINRENAELNLEQTKLQLRKSIQQAYADASAALKKYYATSKTLEATSESFKYSEQRFNVGALNVLDYNTAKTRITKAESDLLQAKYDFIFRTKILDFYQGKALTL